MRESETDNRRAAMGLRAWVSVVATQAALLVLISATGAASAIASSGTTFGSAQVFSGVSPALVPAAAPEFGEEGEGAGQFEEPIGIGIDRQTGDVVMFDTANYRVEEFTATGQFVRTWGWGVSDGQEKFEVCELPTHCGKGNPGSGAGQFDRAGGVAIDNSGGPAEGDIYVVDRENHRVERFGPEGEFILAFGEAGPGPGQFEGTNFLNISVGPTGKVYVADSPAETGRVQTFSPAGKLEGEIPLPSMSGINELLVDSAGDLYALGNDGVHKFDGTGTELGSVRDPGAGAESLALGEGDQLLVSSQAQGHVFRYDPSGAQTLSLALPEAGAVSGGLAVAGGVMYVVYGLSGRPESVRLLGFPPKGPVVVEGSEKASVIQTTAASLEATVNPEGAEPPSYHFEYGESEAYGTETSATVLGGGEFEDQPAASTITGLKPGTVYHFRVLAENVVGQKAEGPDETFETLPPVSIESESATEVTADGAKLAVELNPHGLPSEYHFEYGTTTGYGQSAPEPDAQAGEGSEPVAISIAIQHLSANTTYHYRVVAHNSLGISQGLDHTFTTQTDEPPSLLDGRALEMVSPPHKNGAAIEPLTANGGAIQAAADGSGIAYVASNAINDQAEGNHSLEEVELLARRAAPGVWSTQDIATPHQSVDPLEEGAPSEYKLFSSNLENAAVVPSGATPLAPRPSEPNEPNAERTPYIRNADGTFTPLVWKGDVAGGVKFGGTKINGFWVDGVEFIGASPDLSHVVLQSDSSVVEGFESNGFANLYEWSAGKLAPVTVGESGELIGGTLGIANYNVSNAISVDGSRVFFSDGGQLFMRDMTLGPTGETLRIDRPEAGIREAPSAAKYQFASADGSVVFFTDEARLTANAHSRQGSPDLYECKIEVSGEALDCKLTDLSADSHANEVANVQGAVLGAGEDGHRVYFAATGALGEGEEAKNGVCPVAGEGECVNLYELETQSRAARPHLVAVLSRDDEPDWLDVLAEYLPHKASRVSPDGRYLAFMSKRSLTGYDNRDAKTGARDEEVYEFDAESGRLSCVSCDPDGQRPNGEFDGAKFPGLLVDASGAWHGQTLAGSIPGWTAVGTLLARYQSRYLSDSGRLFFDSPVGLVPGDSNSKQDVYEYEPEGSGSCTAAPACLGLVSSGTSNEESAFLDASESGDDVFFLTAAQLSKQDTDTAFDVYDAHVCSSAPGCAPPTAAAPPPCQTSDACRPAATPQPGTFGPPATQTFQGPGNLNPTVTQKSAAKPLTKAQKLKKAVAACKKRHPRRKRRRVACERAARKKYAPAKPATAHHH